MVRIKYQQKNGKLRTIYCGTKSVNNVLELLALLGYKVLSQRSINTAC